MIRLNLLAATALMMTLSASAHGQSRPGATVDDSRTVLPRTATPFAGQIGQTWQQSRPDFPKPLVAPEGAPNVLLILTDDTGFGHASTFGGGAATPVLEQLARDGLRYNRFHTTALCSPTRAALLTGRNHHSVGTGVIMEMATGYPGYTGIVPNSAVGVPEILRLNGYATGCFGKWHNTPATEVSAAGPFERWPTGSTWGCDTFYGFMAGETDQYYPVLYRNTTPLNPPRTPEQGYSFSEDMADETIAWINNVGATDPKKPWFIYLATPGVHEPHQAPKEYRDKYKGKFDAGWDNYREETFARQKRLGVVPADAKLPPLPKEVPAWEGLSQDAKKVYARMMENYSAYLEYTDAQIGRVIGAVAAKGQLDNTLIIYIVGDNGASAEGGLEGTVNGIAGLNGIQLGLPGLLAKYDDIGGPETEPNIPVGWAIAADTPFQWTKQVASHFGGTRNPMVISWPKRIRDKGGLRSQFLHCIDVVPTILQAVGVPQPQVVNGVQQKPIEGVTFLSTFDSPGAPEVRTTQYFEMMGNRAIYKDGWLAATRHGIPWMTAGQATGFESDVWELYDLTKDFTQADSVAAQSPEKLKELQAAFDEEARKYNVFPLDDRMAGRFDLSNRPNALTGLTSFTYGPGVGYIQESAAINTHQGFSITAEVERSSGSAEGVIAAMGGKTSGWSLFVRNGRPIFYYNFFSIAGYRAESPGPLPEGKSTVRVEFTPEEKGYGKPAVAKLLVNGRQTATVRVERTVPVGYSGEGFDVGADNISAVSPDYKSPFSFNGKIHSVTIAMEK
ncbi:sulfatase-like hydrolase/transferase [Bradyrhizobium sp. CCGB01]|uniref:sulfatase-like hydrolase/transferase n=1 Tax=Bradyrhizobium sp. CCGB01 TaxID=2949634 RepID=UPI0020B345B5|nr:sulfatase-like hydrolase/transferase [Bradyrhizobium sp. CCGB01]MCP3408129.1 sulfatase-like hydrolase/transferase [Bradyrhizobium sp. CCGB01]